MNKTTTTQLDPDPDPDPEMPAYQMREAAALICEGQLDQRGCYTHYPHFHKDEDACFGNEEDTVRLSLAHAAAIRALTLPSHPEAEPEPLSPRFLAQQIIFIFLKVDPTMSLQAAVALLMVWAAKEAVARPVRDYLDQLAAEAAEVQEGPEHKAPKYLSETDPQAAWSTKDGRGLFSYETNYLIDTDHGIIMDVEATPARLSQEIVAARKMLTRTAERHAFRPDALAADKSCGTGPFLAWLLQRGIAPHVPVLDRQHQTDGKYDLSHFSYDADRDSFTCLEGHEMRLRKVDPATRIKRYSTDTETCGACPIRKACTTAPARTVTRHMDEEARQVAGDLARTEPFEVSHRKRKKAEMLFAHLKRNLGFTRLRLRGLRGAEDEFLLAATAQNLKRLAKLVPA